MVLVIQRCKSGKVIISNKIIVSINRGMVILIGVEKEDTRNDVDFLVNKIIGLRIFIDKEEKINLSIKDINGSILIVSQFTLCAETNKGRRPSFINAASSIKGEKLYNYFISELKNKKIKCKNGKFGFNMDVSLVNDGPFTLVLNSNLN